MILNRLLDGFEGKLTTSKYALLAKTSNDTALRDIQFLFERGILVRNPEGGRSTSYELAKKHSTCKKAVRHFFTQKLHSKVQSYLC
jgi:hypothetical protein